jgi:hypothetical protein
MCPTSLNFACRISRRQSHANRTPGIEALLTNMYLACYSRLAAGIAIPVVAVLITPKDGTPLFPPPKSTSTESGATEHKKT